jgi:hypothetical protein
MRWQPQERVKEHLISIKERRNKVMSVRTVQLLASSQNNGTAEGFIDLGAPAEFLAWGVISWIDPKDKFDGENAVGIEIVSVDDHLTPKALSGGALGPDGSPDNFHQGAFHSTGQRIKFRLRAFHTEDLVCLGYGIVIAATL